MFMQRLMAAAVVLPLAFTLPAAAERSVAQANKHAQLVVRNATIYTVDAARSWAQAMAIKEGRIVFIGHDREVSRWIGPRTKVVDARGKLVLPGFHDTHVHLALSSSRRQYCDLGYPKTLDATLAAIAACAHRAEGSDWVLMNNPNTTVFRNDRPIRELLDAIEGRRPMVINGLHSSFVNSAALARAGITATTANPADGEILRNRDGTATGTLRQAAQDLLYSHVPELTKDEVESAFRELLATLPSHGIVSVQELSGSSRAELYDRALAKGWLTVRLRHGQMLLGGAEAPPLESGSQTFVKTATRFRKPWLNAGTVKIFVDGDLGDRTAALFEPYSDSKRERGEPIWSEGELNAWSAKLDAAGIQLHFHAMGDRAVHMALNAIEHAQKVNGRRDARHQITHLHVIADADLPRFRKLGVVANVQPYFAENIAYNTVLGLELLGAQRHQSMFRFRDLLSGGAMVAASTDGPVASPLNPFVSIQAALTRQEPGSTEPPFLPEQRLTLPEVLAAYTIGGAYANFLDAESGSLEVGKWADFVLLDRNLFDTPVEEIRDARVLWTVLEGREVFRSTRW